LGTALENSSLLLLKKMEKSASAHMATSVKINDATGACVMERPAALVGISPVGSGSKNFTGT